MSIETKVDLGLVVLNPTVHSIRVRILSAKNRIYFCPDNLHMLYTFLVVYDAGRHEARKDD